MRLQVDVFRIPGMGTSDQVCDYDALNYSREFDLAPLPTLNIFRFGAEYVKGSAQVEP
jgi:hypothetical protein